MKNIIFDLNNNEYIVVELPADLSEIFKLDWVSASYHNKQNAKTYCLIEDVSMYIFGSLSGRFSGALKQKLKLHNSIKQEIGYLWNEYFWNEDKIKLEYDIIEGREHWIGNRYLLWSSKGTASWIYEKDDKIIFEITSDYDYVDDLSEEVNELKYQEFLKNYKPLVVTTVTREAAQAIVDQAEKVLAQLDANHEAEDKKRAAQNS